MKTINGEEVNEEQCLNKHNKLIWSVVRKYTKSAEAAKMEWGDLYNVGAIGLIKAYRNFDHDYGVKFSTYAVPMIQGEIQCMIRDHGRLIRPSRKSMEIHSFIKRNDLFDKQPAEISEEMGVTEEQVILALNSMQAVKSTNQAIYNDKDGSEITIDDMVGAEEDFTHIHVEQFLETLPNNLRITLEMKMKSKTQYEIGEALGKSQVQISRYLKQIAQLYQEWESDEMKGDLEKAKKLLESTDRTPCSIAKETGISDGQAYYHAKKIRGEEKQPKGVQKKEETVSEVLHNQIVDEKDRVIESLEEEVKRLRNLPQQPAGNFEKEYKGMVDKYEAMKAKHDKLLEYITL